MSEKIKALVNFRVETLGKVLLQKISKFYFTLILKCHGNSL